MVMLKQRSRQLLLLLLLRLLLLRMILIGWHTCVDIERALRRRRRLGRRDSLVDRLSCHVRVHDHGGGRVGSRWVSCQLCRCAGEDVEGQGAIERECWREGVISRDIVARKVIVLQLKPEMFLAFKVQRRVLHLVLALGFASLLNPSQWGRRTGVARTQGAAIIIVVAGAAGGGGSGGLATAVLHGQFGGADILELDLKSRQLARGLGCVCCCIV